MGICCIESSQFTAESVYLDSFEYDPQISTINRNISSYASLMNALIDTFYEANSDLCDSNEFSFLLQYWGCDTIHINMYDYMSCNIFYVLYSVSYMYIYIIHMLIY